MPAEKRAKKAPRKRAGKARTENEPGLPKGKKDKTKPEGPDFLAYAKLQEEFNSNFKSSFLYDKHPKKVSIDNLTDSFSLVEFSVPIDEGRPHSNHIDLPGTI